MTDADEPLVDRFDPAAVRESTTVHAGMVWDVVRETFALGDAGDLTREFVTHPGAVAIVALDESDRALLIQQYRHPIGTYEWELPAGLLDVPGEPPVECAKRELHEEADLVAASWAPLVSHHSSPGGISEILHIFIARDLTPVPEGERHERDGEEADMPTRWAPIDEVVDAIMAGRIHNGTLIVGVLAAAEQLRRP